MVDGYAILIDAPVEVDCACEVGGLADSFRAMRDRLNSNILRMNRLTFTDPVTNLPNRAVVNHVLRLIHRHQAVKSCDGALVIIALDGFKRVNDTLGHEAGNELLRQASARISTMGLQLTPSELDDCTNQFGELKQTCPTRPVVARSAGDEFILLLPAETDSRRIIVVLERILESLRTPFDISGATVTISASMGVARLPIDTTAPEDLLSYADIAVYAAKQGGRDQFRFFDASLMDAVVERNRIENDLREAIAQDALTLHFQPKLSARTMAIRGVEALVRWRHPELGDIPPDKFVKIAETTGLITALDSAVLRLAVKRAQAWVADGAPKAVAVNISATQFMRPEFVGEVLSLIEAHGIDSALIELEVTERIVMADFSAARKRMDALQSAGVRISIDDFGTGYSNLSQLSQLSFDTLKIDKSLVDGIGVNSKSEAILSAIVQMAHALGHTVVAEGVELPEQHAFLQSLGCDEVQGYLFSRALSEDQLALWEVERSQNEIAGLMDTLSTRWSSTSRA